MIKSERKKQLMQTIQGVQNCAVPDFDPATYKGLRSGIGKERRSSKHFNCKCCVVRQSIKKVNRGK